MTGRDTPSSDSVVGLLGEAGVPGDPALLRALEGVESLGAGSPGRFPRHPWSSPG
jgi:hypothetical protein